MGLSGPYSNYKILSEKVKQIKSATSVDYTPDPELTDLSYNPKSIVKQLTQQQKHHFSNKEISEIVKKYYSGSSVYVLAEQYGCHRDTISHLLKKQGVTVTIEKIDLQEAIMLYESGWTTKQIGAKYGISDNAVSRRLKKAGIKMRTRWDY